MHQRATGVKRNIQFFKRLEDVKKRQVAVLVSSLENVVEVSDRLMVMQYQAELDFGRGHELVDWSRVSLKRGCSGCTTWPTHKSWDDI